MDSNGIGDLGKFDFMNKGMYPMSQIDRSYYATPTQSPLAAQSAQGDYDPATNPLTGEPIAHFKEGGDAEEPTTEEVKPPTMAELAAQIKEAYRGNSDYSKLWKQFEDMKSSDPKEWYKNQLDFLGNQVGWQQGQGTSDRIKAIQPQIENTIADAKKAGLSENEISSILGGSAKEASAINQERIASEKDMGSGIGGIANRLGPWSVPLAAAMVVAPELLAASGSGGFGLTGASTGGIGLTGASTGGIGLTGGALGTGVPASLAMPTTGALAGTTLGGSGILSSLGNMSAQDALIAKLGLDMVTGGAGGQGTTGGGTTTTSTPFSTGTGTSPYSLQYNPNSNNLFASAGLTNEGYYGYKPTTYGYDYGIKPLALRAPSIGSISRGYAEGGIADLGGYAAGGKLLKGPGDGMSDSIVANIAGKQPARLADGEFVIPADVVSHLGNGSTDAGAKQLYKMMDRVRHARTGNKKQGKQINPNKFLPKG